MRESAVVCKAYVFNELQYDTMEWREYQHSYYGLDNNDQGLSAVKRTKDQAITG
jgi:hypothetical protein